MTATILVVDDLEPNLKLLEAKLLSEYYSVVLASNGKIAIQKLQENEIDLILLDAMMPEMDGFETCKKIKSDPLTAHIPIVMVTALSELEDRVKGLEAGADEFLTKPVNDIALFARVKSLTRFKDIIDELKLRNQTNISLGMTEAPLITNFIYSKIAIVDDDVIEAKNISKYLSKLTDKISIFTNSDDLLSSIETSPPDVFIISGQLASEDPLRICVSIRSNDKYKDIPFVLLADDENNSMVIKGLEIGINDYFVYPVDEKELIARIKTQIRRKYYQDNLKTGLENNISMAFKDGLTGAFNRRYFDAHITKAMNNPNKKSFAVCMLDIDHFKHVNDTYGHQAGDEVLKTFANIIQGSIRVSDLLARYGGEEFVIILSDTKKTDALSIAERIRVAIERHKIMIPGSTETISITSSIGIAMYEPNNPTTDLVSKADEALYRAKEGGRNRVIVND